MEVPQVGQLVAEGVHQTRVAQGAACDHVIQADADPAVLVAEPVEGAGVGAGGGDLAEAEAEALGDGAGVAPEPVEEGAALVGIEALGPRRPGYQGISSQSTTR
jgi:hypothetical protein